MRARDHVFYITLLSAFLAARPGAADPKAFAEYWVPQSDGEIIRSYLIGKRRVGIEQYAVAYRSVDSQRGRRSAWKTNATVDCRSNSVTEDGDTLTINPNDKDTAMATITAENLWWLVCRGVQAKYRPHMPVLE